MRRSRPYWLALCLGVHSASAQAGNLLPNLYVGLECKDVDPNRIEADFERFFADNNFRFTNRSRFVRENGRKTPFSTQIIALKQNQMMVLEKAGYYNNKHIVTVTARSPEDNDMSFYEKVSVLPLKDHTAMSSSEDFPVFRINPPIPSTGSMTFI